MSVKHRHGLAIDDLSDEEFDQALERVPVLDWQPYITIDPDVAFGKPAITGTRIAVEFVLDLFAGGWGKATVLESYPSLTSESLRAVFAYAADLAHAQQPRRMRRPEE